MNPVHPPINDPEVPDEDTTGSNSPDSVSVNGACRITGRSKSTINLWIKSGDLPCENSQAGRLVPRAALIALHESRTPRPRRGVPKTADSTNVLDPNDSHGPGEQSPGGPVDSEASPTKDSDSKTNLHERDPVTIMEGTTPPTCAVPGVFPAVAGAEDFAPIEQQVEIRTISFDDSTQVRLRHAEKIVKEYAEKMKSGERFAPVVLFRDGDSLFIGDGWHRLLAARLNGYVDLPAHVFAGGKSAALRHALRANTSHGVRLTGADKRNKVKIALREYSTVSISSNEIAKICAVSESLVRSIRDRFVKNEPPTRVGADGKHYPAKKAGPRNGISKGNLLFKKTAALTKKLTLENLVKLKDMIEKQVLQMQTSKEVTPRTEDTKPESTLCDATDQAERAAA